jgi:TrmH family RNA methyltransferase
MVTKAEIKHIRSLHRSKGRNAHKQFIIEGRRLVKEVLFCKQELQFAYYTRAFQKNHSGLLKDVIKQHSTAKAVSPAEMKTMSAAETPQGILGVCIIPENPELDVESNDNWLYLDNIADPGNMGTLLRTAAWFGINTIALSAACVDIYNPKVVRSGMGAHFNITCTSNTDIKQFNTSHTILGADYKGENLSVLKINAPWVMVLGSEAHGISSGNLRHIQHLIAIPKTGTGESLNVAVAGGILLSRLTGKN